MQASGEYPWMEREKQVNGRMGQELALRISGFILLFAFIRVAIFAAIHGLGRKFLMKILADCIIRMKPWLIFLSFVSSHYFQLEFIPTYHTLRAISSVFVPKDRFVMICGNIFKIYSSFVRADENMVAFAIQTYFFMHRLRSFSIGFIDILHISLSLYSANRRPGDGPEPFAVKLVLAFLS